MDGGIHTERTMSADGAQGIWATVTGESQAQSGVTSGSVEDASIELVRRAQGGDRDAFRKLYDLHKRLVARAIVRMTGPNGDHEDALQEVFIQVFRSLGSFRGDARFTTWLHRVAVNVVLMQRRAAHCRPMLGRDLPNDLADDTQSPHENAARNERVGALYEILDKLTDKKRAVFVLHDIEGLPPAQIAELVGAPVLTVRTRLFYARQEVMDRMARSAPLSEIARSMAS